MKGLDVTNQSQKIFLHLLCYVGFSQPGLLFAACQYPLCSSAQLVQLDVSISCQRDR